MINLRNDYCAIAHPSIIEAIATHVNDVYVGYGLDTVTEEAKQIIKEHIQCPECDIHLLVGGTITNKVLISHVLKPYEAVICCDSGHINVHETGTIEQSGHKVLTCPHQNGKIIPSEIERIYNLHTDEHMVKPKMVYISNSTEFGTVYTLNELKEISAICRKLGLYFYMDGARLGVAMTSHKCDYKLSDIVPLLDAFYIGGTKNGLMLGEALIIINKDLKKEVRFTIKQLGGMYAKGFINGIQFKRLFSDELFYEIGSYQNKMAYLLHNHLQKLGVQFEIESDTNQIFPIFDNELIKNLSEKVSFEMWSKGEKKSTIRFVTHFLTTIEEIDSLCNLIVSFQSKC